jgi:hydroxysqualene synthase
VVIEHPGASRADVDRAYEWCARIAREHYENFPVASLLLPKRMRPPISAIYAFARRADDFADEPGPSDSERLRLLDDWVRRLHSIGTKDRAGTFQSNEPSHDDLVFLALADAISRHRLPISLFEDLVSAFRQDVVTTRYSTWSDVLDYCRRSANPIGRLVLRVAGYDSRTLDAQSDAICTALQLTNFWQDFGVDWQRGRLYLPIEDRERSGADERDLREGRWTDGWRRALEGVVHRTRELFVTGRPLCEAVSGRLKWELRVTWLGGWRVLDKVQASSNALHERPKLTRGDFFILLGQAAAWR